MRLQDKIVMFTGSAIGIGRVEACLFASEGAKLVTCDILDAEGEDTAAMIKKTGGEAVYMHADMTKTADVKKLVDYTFNKYGRIDIIVNNVGIPQKPTPVEDIDEELWDRVHNVNLKSVFLTSKYAVPHMKKARKGAILNMSTMNSVRPQLYHCALASAKNSVIALTRALALELAPFNIRANCISPWTVATPSFEASLNEAEKQEWINKTPLGRVGKPEDIAQAALYLVSDESSWVTGVNLSVDGGYGI